MTLKFNSLVLNVLYVVNCLVVCLVILQVNDPNPMVELFVQYLHTSNVPTPIAIKPTIKYDS